MVCAEDRFYLQIDTTTLLIFLHTSLLFEMQMRLTIESITY